MVKISKSRKQLNEVNFDKWLMENQDNIDPINDIILMLIPIKEHLPNLESFILWLMEFESGFFNIQYEKITSLNIDDYYSKTTIQDKFIDEFDEKLEQYEIVERAVYIRIVLSALEDANDSLKSIRDDAWNEMSTDKYVHYQKLDYYNFTNGVQIFEKIIYYYIHKFTKLNINLPFDIIEKNREVRTVGEKFPNIDWYIDIPKSNKNDSNQAPLTHKQIQPIQLEMSQRQIIYLFQKLIDENLLNDNKNPTVWDLVSQYFTAKDSKPLKNLHQNKDGLKNTKTGKPKKNSTEIDNIVFDVKSQE